MRLIIINTAHSCNDFHLCESILDINTLQSPIKGEIYTKLCVVLHMTIKH